MVIPEGLTLPIIIGAALLDSINPCVFGVLIFLIAFMTKVFKSPTRMLLGGLFYTAVVYISYFLINCQNYYKPITNPSYNGKRIY